MANRKVKGEIDQLFVVLKNQINSCKRIFYDVKKIFLKATTFLLKAFNLDWCNQTIRKYRPKCSLRIKF